MIRFLIILSATLATSCAGELTPSKRRTSGTADVQSLNAESTSAEKWNKYVKLKEVNNSLCLRAQKQFIECPLASPLQADDTTKVLGCVSGVDPNANVGVDYKISVQPPSGTKIYLRTSGGLWRTNEVGAGSEQKLTWGPMQPDSCRRSMPAAPAQSQIRSPKLLEVKDIEVVIVPDDKSKCSSNGDKIGEFGAFEINLNGNPLFRKGDLTFKNGGHFLKLSPLDSYIFDLEKRNKCIVPAKEIEGLIAQAEQDAPTSTDIPAGQEATLADDMNREASRNNALQQVLSGQEKLGCWAFAKIDKLEVKIDGRSLPRQGWGTGEMAKGDGNGRAFSFTFGRGLTHSVSEESGIFRPGGGFALNSFADRYLQEIQMIQIEKHGTTFENEEFSTSYSCGFLGLGRCTKREFRRYETDRRHLGQVKILVNDQLIYERSMSHDFQKGSLSWSDRNIQNNDKYRDLMRRTDCPSI
jgi:hypothetical protein